MRLVVSYRPTRQSLRKSAARLLSRIPSRALDYLDAMFQEAQGKGWGYAGVQGEVNALSRLLKGDGLGPPSLIFDVGANIGEWAGEARMRWPRADVVCFEPSQVAVDLLRTKFSADPRIRVVGAAVGASIGEASLFADRPGSALSSLRRRRLDHFDLEFPVEETVKVTTLDSFLEQSGSGRRVDVIKIDVEGSEMDVLLGAPRCLEHVRAVQFEWGEASTGSPVHWLDFWYFWRDMGMRLFRISPRGITEVTRYHPRDEVMTWTNYVAVRPEDRQ